MVPAFSTQRLSNVCVGISWPSGSAKSEWWVLLTSDEHWDHPSSDHALQKKHLDEAKKRMPAVHGDEDVVRVAFFSYRCDSCRATWHDHLDGRPLMRRAEYKH